MLNIDYLFLEKGKCLSSPPAAGGVSIPAASDGHYGKRSPAYRLLFLREMDSRKQTWDDWLQSSSSHAQSNIPMMEAGAGKYFKII